MISRYSEYRPSEWLSESLKNLWPSQDVWTGDAWPSSVRGLNCTLKWANERNPRCVLQVSHETAPTKAHEAENFFRLREFLWGRKERMTPGQHVPLISWATHIIQWPLQRVAKRRLGANRPKAASVRIGVCNSTP